MLSPVCCQRTSAWTPPPETLAVKFSKSPSYSVEFKWELFKNIFEVRIKCNYGSSLICFSPFGELCNSFTFLIPLMPDVTISTDLDFTPS